MIAQKTRYALRSLLFLAEEQGGAPVQLSRIAETQRVPPKYLELIMLDLKKAGLVKSARGPKGGYKLTRPAHQISFGEIVRSIPAPGVRTHGLAWDRGALWCVESDGRAIYKLDPKDGVGWARSAVPDRPAYCGVVVFSSSLFFLAFFFGFAPLAAPGVASVVA